jgi:hypothetical protein
MNRVRTGGWSFVLGLVRYILRNPSIDEASGQRRDCMVDLWGRHGRAYVRSWTMMHDAGTCRGSRIRSPATMVLELPLSVWILFE